MRLSTEPTDPGYPTYVNLIKSRGFRFIRGMQILRNGAPVTRCITVDTLAGYLMRIVCDEGGRPIVRHRQVQFVTETGRVEIVLPSSAPGMEDL